MIGFAAMALAGSLAQQLPTPPAPRRTDPPSGTDLVDRGVPEQKLFEVPPWTGTADELKAAEQRCREAYGAAATVKVQDRFASCCRTAETPFGLCDSLTFK